MNSAIVLDLIEAQVTLYAAQADGTPGSAIWSGQVAERLSVHERWLTVQTRPTGAAHPVNHPLVPTYEIAIDRVWALPLSNLIGFQPGAGNYVLQVVWTDEDSGTRPAARAAQRCKFDKPRLWFAANSRWVKPDWT